MKELEKKAEEIGKKYLMKKAEEEKVFRELNEKNKKKAEELQKHFENNLNKVSQENNNLKRQIEELIRKQTPPPPPPPQVNYFRATPYTGVSIVDGLAAIGEPRSYDYRAQIAARNGIGGYVGSPAQNTHMLNLLKQGRLIKP